MKRSALVLAGSIAGAAASLSLAAPAFAAAHPNLAAASAAKKPRKPKRGPRGPRGAQGQAGTNGAAGKDGAPGKVGPEGKEGPEGKQGPSGIVFADTLDLSSPRNSTLSFLGETRTYLFGRGTVAIVTASMGFGSSDGKRILSHFGICYQPIGGAIEIVDIVQPEFLTAQGESVVQTVSGAIRRLDPGEYVIGACSFNESANTVHAVGYASVLVGEARESTPAA